MTRETIWALDDFSLEVGFWGIDPDNITDEDTLIMDEMDRRREAKT